jgi:hypothetical protein
MTPQSTLYKVFNKVPHIEKEEIQSRNIRAQEITIAQEA